MGPMKADRWLLFFPEYFVTGSARCCTAYLLQIHRLSEKIDIALEIFENKSIGGKKSYILIAKAIDVFLYNLIQTFHRRNKGKEKNKSFQMQNMCFMLWTVVNSTLYQLRNSLKQ